jgi:hypothetical protein
VLRRAENRWRWIIERHQFGGLKMRTFMAALAGLALLTVPLDASARGGSHGGGGGSGGFHGGGFHDGGGFRGGGGLHDGGRFGGRGFGGRGFRGRGFGEFDDGFFFGADLGFGFYDPWFYGYYGYPDYGDYAYPSYTQYIPQPTDRYYRGSLPIDDGASRAGAPQADGPRTTACGVWRWEAASQTYHWVTDGC